MMVVVVIVLVVTVVVTTMVAVAVVAVKSDIVKCEKCLNMWLQKQVKLFFFFYFLFCFLNKIKFTKLFSWF